jgi:hypothetical protein
VEERDGLPPELTKELGRTKEEAAQAAAQRKGGKNGISRYEVLDAIGDGAHTTRDIVLYIYRASGKIAKRRSVHSHIDRLVATDKIIRVDRNYYETAASRPARCPHCGERLR